MSDLIFFSDWVIVLATPMKLGMVTLLVMLILGSRGLRMNQSLMKSRSQMDEMKDSRLASLEKGNWKLPSGLRLLWRSWDCPTMIEHPSGSFDETRPTTEPCEIDNVSSRHYSVQR